MGLVLVHYCKGSPSRNLYIKELPISLPIKAALQSVGLTELSELEEHNYITLAKILPQNINLEAITNELNPMGYLLPPENEIFIHEVIMSKRLQNILLRNNIMYLSQLSSYPKEEILCFRNMGEKTFAELESICKQYNIRIRSLNSLKEALSQYKFSTNLYPLFFDNNITCVEDFKQKNTDELYNICSRDYLLTMKLYHILKKNGIELQKGHDPYFFEVLSKKDATLLWHHLNIMTVSQIRSYDNDILDKLTSISPSLATTIYTLLNKESL